MKSNSDVVVVRTGTANMASILAAFHRLGASVSIARTADELTSAARIVLPGVGAFESAMNFLKRDGMDRALAMRLQKGKATLCICLGMQLLYERSEESPGINGLGVLCGTVKRFQPGVRIPHMGWNHISAHSSCVHLESGYGYFANSFRVEAAHAPWNVATSDYGGLFVAAMECGPILACQFHPELSGTFGQGLLRRWLASHLGHLRC